MLPVNVLLDPEALANGNPAYMRDVRDLFAAIVRVQAHQAPKDTPAQADHGTASHKSNSQSVPPVGQRSIDYLLRALVAAQGEVSQKQMLSAVEAVGWTTKAKKPSNAKGTLRAALSKYPEWIMLDGDLLTLTEAGRAFVETLPPLDTTAATQ